VGVRKTLWSIVQNNRRKWGAGSGTAVIEKVDKGGPLKLDCVYQKKWKEEVEAQKSTMSERRPSDWKKNKHPSYEA